MRRVATRLRRGLVYVAALWATTACAGLSEITEPKPLLEPVGSVSVTPTTASVVEGNTTVLQAQVFDELGGALTGRPLFWSSSDSTVARVAPNGEVTALRVGNAQVAVTADGKSAVAAITVSRRAVASVQLSPPSPTLFVNGTLLLQARPLDDRGQPLSDRSISWQSSDPRIAIVDLAGVVTGLAPGTATITATSELRSATIGVTVVPVPTASVQVTPGRDTVIVGQSTQLSAVARDSAGNALAERSIGWSTNAGTIATVSSTGLVLGVAPGTVIVTASNGGRSGTAVLDVLPRPVGAVIVSPSQSVLTVGQTLRLTVQVTDQNGTLLLGRPVVYESSNPTVARVAADGTVSAAAAGTAVITAVSEGRTGTASVSVSPSPVALVRVSPASVNVLAGTTTRLTADALDASGAVLAQRAVTWLSGAPAFFSVRADGTVTALSPGAGVVFASAEGRIGTAAVVVRGVAVNAVVLSPAAPALFVGDLRDFTVAVRDVNGAEISGRVVQWATSDPTVAVVSSTGRVRAVAPGTAVISATVDGVAGTTSVVVSALPVATVSVALTASTLLPGQTTTATVVVRSAGGDVLTGRAVTWTSLTPAVATVSATGTVSAVANGTAVIRATVEGVSGQATLTVSPTPVASVSVSLAASSLFVGQTTQATAVTRSAANEVLSGRATAWSSSNAAVATVSAAGVVTALLPGSATITATSEGQSGTVVVTVSLVPVNSVTVALAASTITVGSSTQATATLRDTSNATLTGRVVAWSSSNSSVATVSGGGVVSAVAPGTASITATSEGKSNAATVTVTLVPVDSVEARLADSTVTVGSTVQGTAVLRALGGAVLSGRPVTWVSSNTAVATVNSSGLVSAVSPGSTTITATSEGKSDAVTLLVAAVPVASVTVTLNPGSIQVGATSTGSAVTRDASNNVLTGRTVTWASSNTGVATVNSSGEVTGVSAGTATITATSETIDGTADITVTAIPVDSVEATLADSTIAVGQTVQAAAITRAAGGAVLTGRTITWVSSNTSVATVNSSGLVTALDVGTVTITATSEGKSDEVTLAVAAAVGASVAVTLNPPTIQVGETSMGTAITRDAGNSMPSGRAVKWRSDDTAVATVSNSGTVTGVGSGSATITASSQGVDGRADITVTATSVEVLEVAYSELRIPVGPSGVSRAVTQREDAASREGRLDALTPMSVAVPPGAVNHP